ncbi:MAG TPA: Mur ligase family protein, partial [Bacteroidia bacterium]|nr:Mur ligase family protein [Bacteroidia bacterium]
MYLLETRVMRGPNTWSGYRQNIIILKLDLLDLEELPTNKIPGFCDRLRAALPTLYRHECSEHRPGGFFDRVIAGTWMGHVVEHVAIELQMLAGMDVGFGRTRSTKQKRVYYILFEYEFEEAGLYAAEAAIRFVEAIARNEPYDVEEDIRILKRIRKQEAPGPSTAALIAEAKSRKIPVHYSPGDSMVTYGQGVNRRRTSATMASTTSGLAMELASDKDQTKRLLSRLGFPVAAGTVIKTEDELPEAVQRIGFPLVIKPLNGNHGRGVTINIQNPEEARLAFVYAKTVSPYVLVEAFISGMDYRFLVINYKVIAVAKRTPAMVIGDGYATIGQLIDKTNEDPRRGEGHENALTKIVVDEATERLLAKSGLTLQHVVPLGQVLFLKETANLSTGGTARDVTDLVHPYNITMAERIARAVGLDICGIDIMAKDINIPILPDIGVVLEVNACPGFRMHVSPSGGFPKNVAAPVIDMLYPKGSPSRIPIVAITGTNGKTTTTRIIAHLVKQAGFNVGYTTTDGIYTRDTLIRAGDCTGPKSSRMILSDPTVDFAVFE